MSFLISQFQAFCRDLGDLHYINTEMVSVNDNPNLHVLVELISHIIPTFENFRLFSEMPFETVQETLNR